MKVKEVIKKLKKYDKEKDVYFMSESSKADEDITLAHKIHGIDQRTIIHDHYEMEEITVVILLNINDKP